MVMLRNPDSIRVGLDNSVKNFCRKGKTSYLIYPNLFIHSYPRVGNSKDLLLLLCIQNEIMGEFPGSPVVRTLFFHCRGPGFNPWLGN